VVDVLALFFAVLVGGFVFWRAQSDSPAVTVAAIASVAAKDDVTRAAASIDATAIADAAVDEIASGTNGHCALISD